MGEEVDYYGEKAAAGGLQHYMRKGHRAVTLNTEKALLAAEEVEATAEAPRDPSTRTTCNRCGTARLHWTGNKQAGTLVMRDEHGLVHKCPDYGVKLSLSL